MIVESEVNELQLLDKFFVGTYLLQLEQYNRGNFVVDRGVAVTTMLSTTIVSMAYYASAMLLAGNGVLMADGVIHFGIIGLIAVFWWTSYVRTDRYVPLIESARKSGWKGASYSRRINWFSIIILVASSALQIWRM